MMPASDDRRTGLTFADLSDDDMHMVPRRGAPCSLGSLPSTGGGRMPGTNVSEFSGVDSAPDPAVLIRAMDGFNASPSLRAAKAAFLEDLGVSAGDQLLDAGCGTGDGAVQLARIVGPAGRITAVDASRAMLAEANHRAAGLPLPLTFQAADVQRLPFPDGMFDVARTETVLQHVADPTRAIGELIRVTRPGGRIGLLEMDFASSFVDVPDHATARLVLDAMTETTAQPRLGHQIGRLLHDRGLVGIRMRAFVILQQATVAIPLYQPHVERLREAGRLDEDAVARWHETMAERARLQLPASGITAFTAVGLKPAG
jgi:SAM-dependent methyltransferase